LAKDAQLKNRVVLITGAAGGLGRAFSEAFMEAGADLVLMGRDTGALASLAEGLKAKGTGVVHIMEVELGDPASISRASASVLNDIGAPDVLVNNAAVQGPIGPLWENNWAAWEEAVRVDLLAPAFLCSGFVGGMIKKGRGSIINISGGGATGPRPNFTAYGSSKAALVRLSETLAHELAGTGVTVNCIAPGAINTKMTRDVIDAGAGLAGEKEYAGATKLSGDDDGSVAGKAARLAVFLASPACEGVTGRLISAVWDPWERLPELKGDLDGSDIYTLRRIVPKDRGRDWDDG